MRTKTIFKLCGAAMLALGLPSLYLAHWGALWQPGIVEYLGWSQKLILRPGLYVCGVVASWLGLWHLWLRWTTAGRVWLQWREDCEYERCIDTVVDYDGHLWGSSIGWRDDFRALWAVLPCMAGRHGQTYYCKGGEEGPRGAHCTRCGIGVPTPDVYRKTPREEHDRVVYTRDEWPISGGADAPEQARINKTLSEGCESRFTHGSDPAARGVRCDKET